MFTQMLCVVLLLSDSIMDGFNFICACPFYNIKNVQHFY